MAGREIVYRKDTVFCVVRSGDVSHGYSARLSACVRKNTYAIGNTLYEKDGEENNCFYIRAVSSVEKGPADGALEDWCKMVNDVADLFDKAADLCSASWDHDDWAERERLWKEYRQTLTAAFDALKPIFHDLDD